ncbi:MAG: CpaF family protein [Bacillota bacterium]|nr:CpaF family protein [Bacillota bacterium]
MSSLYQRLKGQSTEPRRRTGAGGAGSKVERDPAGARANLHGELKSRIQAQLISELDTAAVVRNGPLTEVEQATIRSRILDLLTEEQGVGPLEREEIASSLFAEIVGFGPIQTLLDDSTITEIMINRRDQVYIERDGRLELTGIRFATDTEVMHLIEKIVTPLGRRIDESSPMVDARLPDGSRVNAVIPPLSLKGPTLTIRKFSKDPFQIDDLIRMNTLSRAMAVFLAACVRSRLNIFVSGGTGSGKTTTLNVLSSFIPVDERIVTIEDAAELQLHQDHVVSLETRPQNLEGRGEITVRQLVRNALRMRPNRIVVGEVRSGEALDMLQAMNTGHDGSLTTGHANAPRDMLARLETMVLMAGVDLPVKAIREQVAAAVDLIVQQSRLKDGSRKITHITEVQGMEGDVILLQDIFLFKQTGFSADGKVLGSFRPTGVVPGFIDRLEMSGVVLPQDIFSTIEAAPEPMNARERFASGTSRVAQRG